MDCLTWNETVESVDCDELFGQGIRDVVVVDSRAWDTTDYVVLRNVAEHFGQFLSN
jgi:hypothetical protein